MTADLTQRLKELDCAALCDVFDAMGIGNRRLSPDIRPRGRMTKLAGPVLCIKGCPIENKPARPAHTAFEIDRAAFPNCVAVIETGDHYEGAAIGGNVVASYHRRGCVGAVVDGSVRDVPEMDEMGFGVFSAALSPQSAKGRWVFTNHSVPVSLNGSDGKVEVFPGDFILADAEGAVIIPGEILEQVVGHAEELLRIERLMLGRLLSGEDRETVYREMDPRAHIGIASVPRGAQRR